MKITTKLITLGIIFFILTFFASIGVYKLYLEKPVEREGYITDTVFKHINVGNLYGSAINFLKQKEGFCKNPTISCDGLLTIGYGHVIVKNENFKIPITEEYATSLLKKDLKKAIDFVEDKTKLSGNKSLALGLLAFNIGTGRFLKYLKNDSIINNINKIKKYCHYKKKLKDGQYVTIKSKALQERRDFEIFIFNTYDF